MNVSKQVVCMGIDLGKNNFHIFAVNQAGKEVFRKQRTRSKLLPFLAQQPPCLIGLEACGGANYWSREIKKLGHEVNQMAPQFVKPYVKGNKNDYHDAEAICEAVSRPGMRFVSCKTIAQQDLQSLHRVRQSLVKSRTALSNQIRGLLAEYGLVISRGLSQVRKRVPEILEDADNDLSPLFRQLLARQLEFFRELDVQIGEMSDQIEQVCRQDEASRRLMTIPGLGAQTATAIVAAYGNAGHYRDARGFAASIGLVPRQHSTGGKPTLLGISKRGDQYIRTLLIHGARAVITHLGDKQDKRSRWLRHLVERRGVNRAAVALANKNARIAWALLQRGESYQAA